ncbi:hypothetical protein DFH08DRAFT_217483 [Mycena albidolilacea]|uniref:Uncharacterized protein n=1 Tax=Mycena albidolilacea TaxID=1033008 RepID=A0AAD6ZWL9_9AGAR|nr:hypothetical protein DFH08DRAFT_217483 [Mycena albidolilacea]
MLTEKHSGSHFLTRFHFGWGWLFSVLAICNTYYSTSMGLVRRCARENIQRDIVKTKQFEPRLGLNNIHACPQSEGGLRRGVPPRGGREEHAIERGGMEGDDVEARGVMRVEAPPLLLFGPSCRHGPVSVSTISCEAQV